MWVSNERKRKTHCVIEQEGEKGINDAVCGLHTTSLNKRETERNGRRSMWVAHHVEEEEGKKGTDDTVHGLHAASSNKKERMMRHVGCTLHH